MQKVADDETMGYFEDSDILCDIGRSTVSELHITRKNRAYRCGLMEQVVIATMVLLTGAVASPQQTGANLQLSGGGDFEGQANCGDPFSSCTPGGDRFGGTHT